MKHFFNVEVASDVGVNAAIVFERMVFWISHNKKNGKNFKDDTFDLMEIFNVNNPDIFFIVWMLFANRGTVWNLAQKRASPKTCSFGI